MKCVEIAESKILEEQRRARFKKECSRWKKKLALQLEVAIEKLTTDEKGEKSSRSNRVYRITDTLAEIDLPRLGDAPPLMYAVVPGEGESLSSAVVAALRQLRDSLVAGQLDGALFLRSTRPESGLCLASTPAADPEPTAVSNS